tara:strand:- start:1521 stop:2114 length:594 start_codon:yes stop_codon:yes gene_type:complete
MNSKIKCWNCSHTYEKFSFFCSECNIIQKPVDFDSFRLFSLGYKFSINLKKLEDDYYILQKKLHPDKFINSSEKELLYAQIHSSNLNNAYNVLVNQVSRSNELLKCKGEINKEHETFNDLEVLNEVLDLQEVAENINCQEQKVKLTRKINKLIGVNIKKLNDSFIKNQFLEAKKLTVKISYLEKLLKDIKHNVTFTN